MESVSWGQAIHALPRLKSQDEKLLFNAGIAIKIGNRYDSTGLQEDERTPVGKYVALGQRDLSSKFNSSSYTLNDPVFVP